MTEQQEKRLALIPALAESSPQGKIGRTALMKFMYFLQTLRNVQLGYRFTLYSYGPFDSNVLADLGVAESLHVVQSETVFYPGGYGYDIRAAEKAKWLQERSAGFVDEHKKDVHWVMERFGNYSSAQLEMVSTIIYADREFAEAGKSVNLDGLAWQVHQIKPHFSEAEILAYTEKLAQDKLLKMAF